MNIRAAKIMAAIIATILSSANAFAAPEDAAPGNTEQPADRCLTSPRDYAPPGTRWRYRVERGTGRHCWFLKDDAEKAASKAREPSTTAEEDAAPAPRKKAAAPRSLSDAHAEFSKTSVEQKIEPTPAQSPPAETASAPAPATSAVAGGGNLTSSASSANMLAPTAATRWPDPMATMPQANPAATSPALPAPPVEQTAEVRAAPAAAPPPPRPQTMPRVMPPVPASEKPMSMPMLITIVAGGLSVLGVLVSLLFAWLSSRRARLAPIEPMPPLEMPDELRRPGDLYRERKRLRAQKSGWRAA